MADNDKPEEVLYYMENGFMVFTEAFHLKRGYCCTNGCRHCPFKKSENDKRDTKEQEGEDDVRE